MIHTDEIENYMFNAQAKKVAKPHDNTKIYITLGSGLDFGISDHGLFIRRVAREYYNDTVTLDLGPATKENFRKMISFMTELEIHMTEGDG